MQHAKTRHMKRFRPLAGLRAALAILALCGLALPAAAASSAWESAHGGKVRLIAPGGALSDGRLRAGIEIALDPGWKTYWRQPGDAGIPPHFDHSKSINLDKIEIGFPAPHRFPDPSGTSIGYKGPVVLPVTLTPSDPTAPIVLDLAVEYGLCEKICVPATAHLRLEIDPSEPLDAAVLETWEQFASKLPGKPGKGLSVVAVSVKNKIVTVKTEIADPDAPYDLFVEAPEDWYLPPPDRLDVNGRMAKWRVALEWVPKSATISGTELRFTLINGERAVEQTWRLD